MVNLLNLECPIGGAVKRAFRRQISFKWGDAKRKNSFNFSFKLRKFGGFPALRIFVKF